MSFSVDLSRAIEGVKEDAEDIIKGTVFQLFTNVIKRTPVGNPTIWKSSPPKGYIGGTLRNSWHCTTLKPSEQGVRSPSESGVDSLNSLAAISGYDLGETIYLTNNAPYAYRVEFGWSSQAPAGMVRVSLAEVKEVIGG